MAKLDRVDRLKKLGGGSVLILIIRLAVPGLLLIFFKWVLTPDPLSGSLEAKQYIRSINRGQQSYFAEHGKLSNSLNALGLGINKMETINYKYSISATKTASFHYAISKQANVKSYVGGVFVVLPNRPLQKSQSKAARMSTPQELLERSNEPNTAEEYAITVSIICASDSPGKIRPAKPKLIKRQPLFNSQVVCGQGTTQVVK